MTEPPAQPDRPPAPQETSSLRRIFRRWAMIHSIGTICIIGYVLQISHVALEESIDLGGNSPVAVTNEFVAASVFPYDINLLLLPRSEQGWKKEEFLRQSQSPISVYVRAENGSVAHSWRLPSNAQPKADGHYIGGGVDCTNICGDQYCSRASCYATEKADLELMQRYEVTVRVNASSSLPGEAEAFVRMAPSTSGDLHSYRPIVMFNYFLTLLLPTFILAILWEFIGSRLSRTASSETKAA